MSLSKIAKSINPSLTLQLNAKYAALKAEGNPVIHLGGGEPQAMVPKEAIEATEAKLKTGIVRYAPVGGTPALKQSIVNYTKEFYQTDVKKENIIVSSGAKQAIMVALQAILDYRDEVIFPSPYWISYPEMVKLAGGIPVIAITEDGNVYPDVKTIERYLTDKTKAVLLNSPNNPSGAMYSEKFISDVVHLCEDRDIYLIMDDIYHRLIFDGRKPVSAYNYSNSSIGETKLIIVNGVSKQYAMTGFRIGWAVGNKTLISAMTNIQAHQTSGTSILLQEGAAAALNSDQSSVEQLRSNLETNREIMLNALSQIEKVKVTKPDGTFYCFANFAEYETDSVILANFLIDKAQVLTVPGAVFGAEGFLRLSYCGTPEEIVEGVSRIRWALDPNSPKEIKIGSEKIIRDWI